MQKHKRAARAAEPAEGAAAEQRAKKLKAARRIIGWTLAVLILLFVDLVTKQLAQEYFKPMLPAGVDFLPGFIDFRYTENDAIAFGIGSGNRPFMICVTVVTCLFIIGIVWLTLTFFRDRPGARYTLAFIEAGAIGNLVDRLALGYVRDFLDMSAFRPFAVFDSQFNFGVCNVADYFITAGAVVFFFMLIFIGPDAVFPLKKSWREEAKRREEEQRGEERRKQEEKDAKA